MPITRIAGSRTVRRVVALGAIAAVLGAGVMPTLQPATTALAWHDDICWPGGRYTPDDFRHRFPIYDSNGQLTGYDEGKAEQAYFDFQQNTPGAVFVNGNDACPVFPTATPTTPPTATPTTPPASTPTIAPSPTATSTVVPPPDASPTKTPAPTATSTTPPAPTTPPASPTTVPPTATSPAPAPSATAMSTASPQPTSTGVPQDEPKSSGPDQTVIWVCLQRPPSAENPTGRTEFPIKRDESGRYRDQWVNFDARGYPIEGPCPPAPTATATATATRVPATATTVPPTPTAQPTVVAGTPLIVFQPAPVAEVSEVVVAEAPAAPEEVEVPVVIVAEAAPAPVADVPVVTADMYCLVNADLPECRPSTQTSGLGRG
jgi:hypothetical protein